MKVLGLDVATTTGYAILDDKGKLVDYGLISLDTASPYKMRFKQFRKEVVRLLREHKPDCVVLEGVYTSRNPKTSAYLNNLRGLAIEAIPVRSKFLSTTVTAARRDVIGAGNAKKQQVFSWAVDKYKLKDFSLNKHNDITDAIMLAFWGQLTLTKISE